MGKAPGRWVPTCPAYVTCPVWCSLQRLQTAVVRNSYPPCQSFITFECQPRKYCQQKGWVSVLLQLQRNHHKRDRSDRDAPSCLSLRCVSTSGTFNSILIFFKWLDTPCHVSKQARMQALSSPREPRETALVIREGAGAIQLMQSSYLQPDQHRHVENLKVSSKGLLDGC